MNAFDKAVNSIDREGLVADDVAIIQVNVGLKCNQQCAHCHLYCSPSRTEVMRWPTMEAIVEAARRIEPEFIDITGGAPELNPDLRRFIRALSKSGRNIKVRTNLTVLLEEGVEDLPQFFKDRGVHLVASMPCYLQENVDGQRGSGVYSKSVDALLRLNEVGYGVDGKLKLDLVYNPAKAMLPPSQNALEQDYRRELWERFGISFSNLLTIANFPLGRFRDALDRQGKLDNYRRRLRDSFNPAALKGLMCRRQISVGWDGSIYDCDFNLALNLPILLDDSATIERIDPTAVAGRRIITGEHCFGCTAGSGSSCGGALVGLSA